MPTQVRASHILVPTEKQALELKRKIDEGEKFHKVAKRFSTCPSKEQGGDLGFFGKGQMVPEFENAAFGAKAGKVAGPVKTQFGYHLILVTETKD
jgi:peptidyl-prolyl cis-trans isomerase C